MSNYHRVLVDRLTTDPAFAFAFARRFRAVPPIDPRSVCRMRSMLLGLAGSNPALTRPSVALTASTLVNAAPPPGGEPWPARWGVLLDTFDDGEFDPELLLSWPLLHASLRESFGCPFTHVALCPTWDLAMTVNRAFSIEPELMPIVVTAGGLDDLPADIRRQVEAHLPRRGKRKGGRHMN